MNIALLTEGLVVSMVMRLDHLVLFPGDHHVDDAIRRARVEDCARRSVQAHRDALSGKPVDPQLLEEMTGRGFHSPESEDWYRDHVATIPGAREILVRILRSVEGKGEDVCASD